MLVGKFYKYQKIPIPMNQQINIRLSEPMLKRAQLKARKQGFENLQEFMKAILREKLFETSEVSKQELDFLRKLHKVSEENNLHGTEKELFSKLNKK